MKSNLRKPPKLPYLALHSGNNKQNVPLTLETTIIAARSYFLNWRNVARFFEIFNTWWSFTIYLEMLWSMSTKNWVLKSSGRLDWTSTSNCVCIDYYFSCPYCAYRRLTEAYQYVITARLQSYPVERRFSQYRQMSGSRFLDNLREVLNFKRILQCRSLIKENELTTGYIAKR